MLSEELRHAEFISASHTKQSVWVEIPTYSSDRSRVKHGMTILSPWERVRERVRKFGFTLAEVLITLGIIGIVAALTMPALIQQHSKSAVEVSLKKYNSILNEALRRSEVDNGSAVNWEWGSMESASFFDKYFAPYIIITGTKASYAEFSKLNYKVYADNGNALWEFNNSGTQFPWRELPDGGVIRLSNTAANPNVYAAWFSVILPSSVKKSHLVVGKDVFDFLVLYNSERNHTSLYVRTNVFNWTCQQIKEQKDIIYDRCRGNNLGGSGWQTANYCTRIISCNGWKIPDDYPIKF